MSWLSATSPPPERPIGGWVARQHIQQSSAFDRTRLFWNQNSRTVGTRSLVVSRAALINLSNRVWCNASPGFFGTSGRMQKTWDGTRRLVRFDVRRTSTGSAPHPTLRRSQPGAADSPGTPRVRRTTPRFAVRVGLSQPVKVMRLHNLVGLDAQKDPSPAPPECPWCFGGPVRLFAVLAERDAPRDERICVRGERGEVVHHSSIGKMRAHVCVCENVRERSV